MLNFSNLDFISIIIGIILIIFYFNVSTGRVYYLLFSIFFVGLAIFSDQINYILGFLIIFDFKYGNLLILIVASLLIILIFLIKLKNSNNQNINILKKMVARNYIDTSKTLELIGDVDILIIIPSFNEKDNLKLIINQIPKKINNFILKVLIIDDGSDDNTADLEFDNTIIVSHPINLGGGFAVNTGIEISKKSKAKYSMIMDADGQHSPKDITLFVNAINNKTDMIAGTRAKSIYRFRNLTIRKVGIMLFNIIFSILLKTKITDCSSGFRIINNKLLKNISLEQNQYYVPELIVKTKKNKFNYEEIDIKEINRLHGYSKKGTNITYLIGFFNSFLIAFFINK